MNHKSFFITLLLLSLLLFVWIMKPYCTPVLLAIIFASLLTPVQRWFTLSLKLNASFSACIVTLLLILIIGVPVFGFIGLLSKEAYSATIWAKEQLETESFSKALSPDGFLLEKKTELEEQLNVSLPIKLMQQKIIQYGKSIGTSILGSIRDVTSTIIQSVTRSIIFIFAFYFILRDGKKLLAYILEVSPLSKKSEHILVERFEDVTKAIVLGNILIAALQGLVVGIGFLVFGLSGATLAGLATALVALIPAVGPLLIILPAGFFLGFAESWTLGIVFMIITFVVTSLLDNLLKPHFLQKKLKVHPLLVFLSLIGGISMFGLLGIFYGPLIVVIFLTLLEFYREEVLAKE